METQEGLWTGTRNGQRKMDSKEMDSAKWTAENGQREMDSAKCTAQNGQREMDSAK
jgi:hypothetical protein